jgi:Ca-activated chloride channel homolog
MTFHWPHAFWLLLIPLALLVRDLRRRRITPAAHPKIQQAEVRNRSLVIGLPAEASAKEGHWSFQRRGSVRTRWFLYLALAAATAALARPQWGRLDEPVFDQAREIIIALDLSRSMLAADVKPNRLERARLLITSLLERLKGERVGLVVFSGTAFLQSPLSSDYEILREFLPVLDPGYLPEGGTNYDALIETTVTAFGSSGSADRFLIVLSDGEAQSDSWQKHVADLKTKGIRVLGLGIGTGTGAMIPDGDGAFIKDERGAVVLSRLNGTTLRALADQTDGVYTDASSWVDLSALIESTVEQGRTGEFKETSRIRLAERFQWPLAAALAFAFLSFWRESPVRPKPRPLPLTSPLKTAAFTLCLVHWSLGIGHWSFAAEPSTTDAPLTTLIGRLASRDHPSASDYAELARATVTYGQRTQSSGEKVPEGPVRDALAAVTAGEALDPKGATLSRHSPQDDGGWPALREQLNALLPKKEEPPPEKDQSKPDEKKPDQNKGEKSDDKSDDQSGQNGDSSDQPKPEDDKSESGKPKDPQSSGGDNQTSNSSKDGQPPESNSPKPGSNPGQSAFGDMNDPPPAREAGVTPKPETGDGYPSEMQQAGGTPVDASTDPARLDPSLAIPLQKLDQVKQDDSPARLFQLLQEPGPAQPPASKGKNW